MSYNYQYPQDDMQYQPQTQAPLALPSERADLLDKIQPNKIVEVVYHRLLGEIEIDGVWQKVDELQERALTKRGAWDIATLMTPVSSQNVSLSKLNDAEIRARTLSIARTAQIMCIRNWKEYGIKGTDQLHFVHEIVFSNTFVTLKQPEGEGIRVLLKNISSADFSPPSEEKGGWMDLFKGKV